MSGCPLQTSSPIDEGSYTETGWLEGKWERQPSDGSDGESYVIRKHRKPGNMLVYEVKEGKTETKGRSVILSSIGAKIFLSVFEEGDELSDKGYYIYRMIKKSSTAFDLIPVKEHLIEPNTSSRGIRKYLDENQDAGIYEITDTEHYKKNN